MGLLPEAASPPGVHAALRAALGDAQNVRAACQAVVDHLAGRGLMPSVYLELGGRLRCQAVRGYWQIFDGMGPQTGVIGRTFQSGKATVELDVAHTPDYLAAVERVASEICVPIRMGDRLVGALNVESTVPLGSDVLPELERCAGLLAGRLAGLGPLDVPSPAQALARIGARLAALSEPDAIVAETAQAARELSGFGAALLVVHEPAERRFAVGPLGPTLAALSSQSLARMAGWVDGGTSSYTIGESEGRGFVGHEPLRRAGALALAVLPLAAAGNRLGLLVLADHRELRLDPDVVELLELLATQAGSALGTAFAVSELRRRAECDALTGLGHHATFHSELASRRREATSRLIVALIDVDDFKSVNDDLGHASGDAVLRGVAEVLSEPEETLAYRVGGDEFAVIATVRDDAHAFALSQRLRDTIRQRLPDTTISAGVAVPAPGETDSALLARADAALYAAKAAGRDRIVMA